MRVVIDVIGKVAGFLAMAAMFIVMGVCFLFQMAWNLLCLGIGGLICWRMACWLFGWK
jgi:hypothetical protein